MAAYWSTWANDHSWREGAVSRRGPSAIRRLLRSQTDKSINATLGNDLTRLALQGWVPMITAVRSSVIWGKGLISNVVESRRG